MVTFPYKPDVTHITMADGTTTLCDLPNLIQPAPMMVDEEITCVKCKNIYENMKRPFGLPNLNLY